MQEQQKIERLAEGVMGCHRGDYVNPEYPTCIARNAWLDNNNQFSLDTYWNPFRSWEHAGMIIEKMREKDDDTKDKFNWWLEKLTNIDWWSLTPTIISDAALATLDTGDKED